MILLMSIEKFKVFYEDNWQIFISVESFTVYMNIVPLENPYIEEHNHLLSSKCWCNPIPDPDNPTILLHIEYY